MPLSGSLVADGCDTASLVSRLGEDGGVTLVAGQSAKAQNFQWIETPTGELVLMSLVSNRFLRIDPQTRDIRADSPGPMPDNSDGTRFVWSQYKG